MNHNDSIRFAQSLHSKEPTRRLMAEAVLRARFEELKVMLKAAGYTHLTVGIPPGWANGPGNSFSAWPSRNRGICDSGHLWNILKRVGIGMGCGNGGNKTWGDQAQMNFAIPNWLVGTYEL